MKIRVLHKAEGYQRRHCERARRHAAFIADPFRFTKELLWQKRGGKLVCLQEEMDQYLSKTYSDPKREEELGMCDILIDPPGPETQFDLSELQLKEVREVIRKARAGSAPVSSNTSYKVYKNCPKLLFRLWKILCVFWRRGRIPKQWRVAVGVWIPKEENSYRSVPHNFPAERRSKHLLQCCLQPDMHLFVREHLY